MNLYTLDLETYYDKSYSLSKITTEEYIRDPRFETIGVSVKCNDEPAVWFSGDSKATKKWLQSFKFEEHAVLCHHAMFDCAILNWIYGIKPLRILDTLSMANAMVGINESVSLANLAKIFSCGVKGTEVVNALGKRRDDFTIQELAAYGEYCKNDVDLTYALFLTMRNGWLPNGSHIGHVFPKQELQLIDMTIRMFTEPKLVIDAKIVQDNLWDVQLKKRDLMYRLMLSTGSKTEESLQKELMSNDKFAQMLKDAGVDPPTKVSPATKKQTWAFAKTDEGFLDLEFHEDELVQALFAARMGFKSTAEETRSERLLAISNRGNFPIPLSYSGAHITHRFSGSDKVNIQNLKRGGQLRNAVKAPKGYKLVIGDLSNIELRLGLWAAGQEDAVELIKDGIDLYSDFGSTMFDMTYDEIRAAHKEGFSMERFVSKEACLSGIFGVGGAKLQKTLKQKGKLAVDEATSKGYIQTYRQRFYKVVEVWDIAKQVLYAMTSGMEMNYLKDGIIKVSSLGLMKPSGLLLRYPGLHSVYIEGKYNMVFRRQRGVLEKVYGSKCYQRCIQSLARDIMAHMMVKLGKKYNIVNTVHDELWVLVKEDMAEQAKADMELVMSTPPSWCATLPLACEVGIGDSYGAVK